ncbi:MAG: ribosomal protein S18-alanine N-acetyltransferase [Herminiimonas sp.]|nr:ribosomal protein S18-alanine N-acetyltransferase [Herminiimonas sp.]
MRQADLPAVEAIEREIYAHPWSLPNFADSLDSGYQCWVVRNPSAALAGYFLVMLAPDEAHLLNITVAPAWQGRGLARLMFERISTIARSHAAPAVLLEVRPSNPHALAVYRHVGFRQIGVRKRYYPATDQQREDAIVMRLDL